MKRFLLFFLLLLGAAVPAYAQDNAEKLARAVALARDNCAGGDAQACLVIGGMYYSAVGVPQDYAQAVAFYRKGCDEGAAEACSRLGLMYILGIGVAENDGQGFELLHKGCDAGDATGCDGLKTVRGL